MVQRVLLGNLGSGQYGLKVSTPGNDVLSGGTLVDDKLSFDSSATNTLKLYGSGVVTIPVGPIGGPKYDVMYGITFPARPIVFFYTLQTSPSPYYRPTLFMGLPDPAGPNSSPDVVKVDRMSFNRPTAGGGLTIYYFIFFPLL